MYICIDTYIHMCVYTYIVHVPVHYAVLDCLLDDPCQYVASILLKMYYRTPLLLLYMRLPEEVTAAEHQGGGDFLKYMYQY